MSNHETSSGVKSSEDVAQMYRDAFPPGCGDLFYKLWSDVVFLHLDWSTYRSLFGTSPERVDTLNWAAGQFFGTVERVLWNDIVMRIGRLTDPATSGPSRDNASLETLLQTLDTHVPADRAQQWANDLSSLKSATESVRILRNRRLAHSDLLTALHQAENPLPGISRSYIEGVLRGIRDLMSSIELHFRNLSMRYEDSIPALGNAEKLISLLDEAQRRATDRYQDR